MNESNDLNRKIGTVETTKAEMISKFRHGLVKFSETAPYVVACQGNITAGMKHSVDEMYQYFKTADLLATSCNTYISTALEFSGVLVKKIKEKQEEVERDIRKHEREKDDAESEKKRSQDRVRDAEKTVDTAKDDVKKAKSNFTKGAVGMGSLSVGNTAGYAILGGLLGGPIGAIAAGAIAGGVSVGATAVVLEDLEEREKDAERDLSSKKSELTNKEGELRKIRDKIRDCENELRSVKECLDQIEDLERKVRRGQIHVANLSSYIKNCLTVFSTTLGRSKMLRDECLSEMVTFSALVKIVNDLAAYFKCENLQDFLGGSEYYSVMRAIQDIERTSHESVCFPRMAQVAASCDDFMDV